MFEKIAIEKQVMEKKSAETSTTKLAKHLARACSN